MRVAIAVKATGENARLTGREILFIISNIRFQCREGPSLCSKEPCGEPIQFPCITAMYINVLTLQNVFESHKILPSGRPLPGPSKHPIHPIYQWTEIDQNGLEELAENPIE